MVRRERQRSHRSQCLKALRNLSCNQRCLMKDLRSKKSPLSKRLDRFLTISLLTVQHPARMLRLQKLTRITDCLQSSGLSSKQVLGPIRRRCNLGDLECHPKFKLSPSQLTLCFHKEGILMQPPILQGSLSYRQLTSKVSSNRII